MTECKICKTEINEDLAVCNVCKYPLKGTDKEQAIFVAKQVMQKSDVKESIERLKKSRIILFILGAFYIIVPFTPLMSTPSSVTLIFSIVLIINPLYLWTGILWKMIVLMGLGYGYFSVRKSDKILKENEYLASVLGFGEIKNK